jgi:hypothetical protein
MPILPIQAIGALAAAAPLAGAAIEGVSATFAGLLNAATSRPAEAPAKADGPGLGLEGLNGGRAATSAGNAEERLRSQTESLLRQFHQLLAKLLEENDIDSVDGFSLHTDDLGQIRVTDGNGESFRIEELFASNPELRQLFDKIVTNSNLLKSLETLTAGTTPTADTPFPQRSNSVSIVFNSEQAAVASGVSSSLIGG